MAVTVQIRTADKSFGLHQVVGTRVRTAVQQYSSTVLYSLKVLEEHLRMLLVPPLYRQQTEVCPHSIAYPYLFSQLQS